MRQLMCRECGEFVLAIPEGERWVPAGRGVCPRCRGNEFRRVEE